MTMVLASFALGKTGRGGMPALIVILLGAVGIGLILWARSRARGILDQWACSQGLRLLEARRPTRLKGPFYGTLGRNQKVYRVAVECPDGTTRRGWVRVGGRILGQLSEEVEVRWDEPEASGPAAAAPRETPPGR